MKNESNENYTDEDHSTTQGVVEQIPDKKLNKEERRVRRVVYERFYAMRDDSLRKEVELDWDNADKAFRLYTPVKDADDWRADLRLPDAFAAIQAQEQENIDRKSRPKLARTEDSDRSKEEWANAILNHNMDATDFDHEYSMVRLERSIKGTAFMRDTYRYETRRIMDPTGEVDENGKMLFQEKEIVEYDDDFAEFIPNEHTFVDPDARDIKYANDWVYREVLDILTFRDTYGNHPDFMNVEFVKPGGETTNRSFFKSPEDMDEDQVEVLHYENKAWDEYLVVANNVPIRIGPLPNKHKQLSLIPFYQYRVPGYFWGVGIPKVIWELSEERRSVRMLNLDRQKMQINKMFLYNRAYDIDEEELTPRPHGFIGVDTNGQPLNQVMQPLEYGDVPASYFRTEEILLEDIRRAHGIDDRIQGVNVGGTATEAAILKESSLKRVNMITKLDELSSLKRVGKIKWSNVQFFYREPRVEKIIGPNEIVKKTSRSIVVNGRKFSIESGQLNMEEINGTSSFKLDKKMANFFDDGWDIQVEADAYNSMPQAIRQAKTSEMFDRLTANPLIMQTLDPMKAATELIKENQFNPKSWLRDGGRTESEWMELAELENEVMKRGTPLMPTPGANEAHTMVHLMFAQSAEFEALTPEIQEMFDVHISGENDANPAQGMTADVATESGTDPLGLGAAGGAGPEIQAADVTPTNPARAE